MLDDLSIIPPTGRTIVNVISGVELEENGPVQTVMRITGEVTGVPITQRLTLYQGLKGSISKTAWTGNRADR